MNIVDLVVLGAIIVFAWSGWRQGFVAGLLSFIGFLGGGLAAALVLPGLVAALNLPELGGALLLATGILAAALLGQTATSIVGRRLRGAITWSPARALDNVGGAALNVAALAVVLWVIASAVAVLPEQSWVRQVRSSTFIVGIDRVVPDAARDFFVDLRDAVADSPLPRVFSGIGYDAGPQVAAPDEALLRDPAVRASWASLARISSIGCGTGISGSGFVFAPDRILTNAHVVAGIDNPRVRIPGDALAYEATVVAFDPDIDLAVLAVDGLSAAPLSFAVDAATTGDPAVVAGFPGGGELVASPARVRAEIDARGEDIYGRAGVTREVYSFRGDVRPGNSGGPLLAPDGSVYGVVFASGIDDDETGYAITAAQAEAITTVGARATTPAETGPCRAS